MRFRVNEPLISKGAYSILQQVLDSAYLSPGGEWVERFEGRWAETVGTKYAVACSSGTAALHLALEAAGIGEGDEVVVPSLTCPDTLNAVLFASAKPVIVDVELARYGISPTSFQQAITPRTAAVMPVYLYGAPVEEEIFDIASAHGLLVVEDAAEAHGASYGDRRVGSIGDIGCFSFRGDKVIGCGTGGILTTDSWDYAKRARHKIGLASLGDGLLRYHSDEIGYSFEMSNIMAALAYAQIDVLQQTIDKKRAVAATYNSLFTQSEHICPPAPVPGHVYWKYVPVFVDVDLERVYDKFVGRGIEVGPSFVPAYRLPMYQDPSGGDWAAYFPNSEFLGERLLALPSSPNLLDAHLNEIASMAEEIVSDCENSV